MAASTLSQSHEPLRFGVLGTARVLPRALLQPVAASALPVSVARIGSRSLHAASLAEFALEHDIARCGSYQDVLTDRNVHAVYVPLPNGLHFGWALRAIQEGEKHVLVEKPFTTSLQEASVLLREACERNLVVMDGSAHFLHHPAMLTMRSMLRSRPTPCRIRRITARVRAHVSLDDVRFNVRGTAPSLAGGALRDLGVYGVYAGMFLGEGSFDRVRWVQRDVVHGVDASTTTEFTLTSGVVVRVECSLRDASWFRSPPTLHVEWEEGATTVTTDGHETTTAVCKKAWFVNFVEPHAFHVMCISTRPSNSRHGRWWWLRRRWSFVQDYGGGHDDGHDDGNERTSYEHQLDAFYNATQRTIQGSAPSSLLGPPCDDPRHVARAMDAIAAYSCPSSSSTSST